MSEVAPLLSWIIHGEGEKIILSSGNRVILCEQKNGQWINRVCEAPSWVRCFTVSTTAASLVVATQCKKVQIYDISENEITLGVSM